MTPKLWGRGNMQGLDSTAAEISFSSTIIKGRGAVFSFVFGDPVCDAYFIALGVCGRIVTCR